MNWLDIVIIIILGLLTIRGLKKGLIDSLVPLVGIVLAIVLAGIFKDTLDNALDFIDNESAAKIAAFAIIFVGVLIVVSIIGKIVKTVIHMAFMGWIDHLGGAAFGFATGWLICAALVALTARYAALPVDVPDISMGGLDVSVSERLDLDGIREKAADTIEESEMAKLQLDSFPIVLGLLPGEFDEVKDFFNDDDE